MIELNMNLKKHDVDVKYHAALQYDFSFKTNSFFANLRVFFMLPRQEYPLRMSRDEEHFQVFTTKSVPKARKASTCI